MKVFFLIIALGLSITFIFPQRMEKDLVKIFRKDSLEYLNFDKVEILQELKRTYIIRSDPEYIEEIKSLRIPLEVIDKDVEGKEYFLVRIEDINDLLILRAYGNAKFIEEKTALFWTDSGEAREILPEKFLLKKLNDTPIYLRKETYKPYSRAYYFPKFNYTIQEIKEKFSIDNVKNIIKDLENFKTRYASTLNCELAGDYIYNYFHQLGLNVEFDPFIFKNYQTRNVIGILEGKTNPEAIYIICAHYDSYSKNAKISAPGADDNASGTATMMEIARILSEYFFDFSIKFIAFSAEEWGLYGSKHYAEKARTRGERIEGVINLDMIGYADLIPEDLNIILNRFSSWLADRFMLASQSYFPYSITKNLDPSFVYSDHSPFWDKGYDAILGIEDYKINNPYYHTEYDRLETLNSEFLSSSGTLALISIADLSQPIRYDLPKTPKGLKVLKQIISSLYQTRKSNYLSWEENPDKIIGYNIYRTEVKHINYKKLNSSPIKENFYIDKNLDINTIYYYTITAVDTQLRESNFSMEVSDSEQEFYAIYYSSFNFTRNKFLFKKFNE
ncbi:MAG: M20/M25/M40 family metallo-hydrolase [Acidobacteriota bacterium]